MFKLPLISLAYALAMITVALDYQISKGIFILKLNNKCNFVLEINANLHVYNDFFFSSIFP